MTKCIIVGPIYKEQPTITDLLSLRQLDAVAAHNHDVAFVCPESLDTAAYENLVHNARFVRFEDKYFEDTKSYSQLCISYGFYAQFADTYDYMLIYQTDCWIFRDEIDEWCSEGYDYIGGPILSKYSLWPAFKSPAAVPQVGNGGFSLRKLSTMTTLTANSWKYRDSFDWDEVEYEDLFICNIITKHYPLDVPNWRTALNFAWDCSVCEIYKRNYTNGKLPMGCHAVFKQIEFWKNHIPELNDTEILEYQRAKNKAFFEEQMAKAEKKE